MEPNSPKQALRTIQVIHSSLMAGLILFGAVVVFLLTSGSQQVNEGLDMMVYIPPVLFVMAYFAANTLFNTFIKKAREGNLELQQKFAPYQTAHIIRLALMEGTGLFATVVTMITGVYYVMIVLLLVLLFFASKFPTVLRMEEEMGLTPEEKEQLL